MRVARIDPSFHFLSRQLPANSPAFQLLLFCPGLRAEALATSVFSFHSQPVATTVTLLEASSNLEEKENICLLSPLPQSPLVVA